jgi:hypothetical protein
MTTGANIPGLTLGELNIGRSVVRDLRNGDQLNYEDLEVTALCDEHLGAYKEIYDYIMKASDPFTADINVTDPIFDSTLYLTSNKNNVIHQIKFYNCFFKRIGTINLTSATSEGEQITFDIALGFSYFEFI